MRRGPSKMDSQYIQQYNNRKFPKSRESYAHFQVQEAFRMPDRLDQNRTTPQHIIIKQQAQRIQKEY
jgi:hypothetical protein